MVTIYERLNGLIARDVNGDSTLISADEAKELIKTMQELVNAKQDAARWNALINSPFRLFGYAGLNHDNPLIPCNNSGKDGYAHFGCEMWTKHSGWKAGAGKDILIGYADQAIKAQAS